MYFDRDGHLVLEEIPKHSIQMIPVNHVDIIYWNLKAGKDYIQSSPYLSITREQAAFILNNYKGYY